MSRIERFLVAFRIKIAGRQDDVTVSQLINSPINCMSESDVGAMHHALHLCEAIACRKPSGLLVPPVCNFINSGEHHRVLRLGSNDTDSNSESSPINEFMRIFYATIKIEAFVHRFIALLT